MTRPPYTLCLLYFFCTACFFFSGCTFSNKQLLRKQVKVLLPNQQASLTQRKKAFHESQAIAIHGNHTKLQLRNGVVLKEPVDLLGFAKGNKKLQKKIFALQREREKARTTASIGGSLMVAGGVYMLASLFHMMTTPDFLDRKEQSPPLTSQEQQDKWLHPMMLLGYAGVASWLGGSIAALVGAHKFKKTNQETSKLFRRYPELLKSRLKLKKIHVE